MLWFKSNCESANKLAAILGTAIWANSHMLVSRSPKGCALGQSGRDGPRIPVKGAVVGGWLKSLLKELLLDAGKSCGNRGLFECKGCKGEA